MPLTPGAPRIAWYQAGDRGDPVLLLIGFGMRGIAWQPQLEGLAADHRLFYFDNRGLGASDPSPPQLLRVGDLADDALRVLDAAGQRRAHLVGISMGGMAAQELALHHPERVRTLTLIASHAGGLRALTPSLESLWVLSRVARHPRRRRTQALQRLLYPPAFLRSVEPARLRERIAVQTGHAMPTATLLAQLLAVARHDTRRALRRIQVPTLVIQPARDLVIGPRNSEHLARAIPGAELLRLPDAGHGLLFQCAEEINAALRRHFLRS